MKNESISAGTKRNKFVFLMGFLVLAAGLTFLLVSKDVQSGDSAPSSTPPSGATFEEIPGSSIKKVILTDKSAERLGIKVGPIELKSLQRKQVVGGRVIPPVTASPKSSPSGGIFGFSGFSLPPQPVPGAEQVDLPTGKPSKEEVWVHITLTLGEWDRLQKEGSARIMPLATRDIPHDVLAVPSSLQPISDSKRSMLNVYYKVQGKEHGLGLYERVRVELDVVGSDATPRIVAPYSSVYYDAKGAAWVYTNPSPLVFERKPITIERIIGDWAILSEGPPVGTAVAIVGSPLLYGAEVIFKK